MRKEFYEEMLKELTEAERENRLPELTAEQLAELYSAIGSLSYAYSTRNDQMFGEEMKTCLLTLIKMYERWKLNRGE